MPDYAPDMRERGSSARWTSSFQAPEQDALPPQHIEAEMCCLGSMIMDNEKIDAVLRIVDPGDFWRDAHQIICRRIKVMHEKGVAVDTVTLGDDLKMLGIYDQVGGFDTMIEITQCVPHSANATYYAEIVKAKAKSRLAIEMASEVMRRAYSQQEIANDVLDSAALLIESMRAEKQDDEQPTFNPLPEKMDEKAFRGVAGEVVGIIGPHTESCREAIIGQFIVGFGSVIGPRPHWRLEATAHRCNLFLCCVGPTGIARKGTSWDVARWLISRCDEEWGRRPILSGLTSGEGLIFHAKEEAGPLLAVETEFSRTLTNMGRDNSSLSTVLRQAFDGPHLRVPTRNNPITCDDAYISMIAHTTLSDIKAKLRYNEIENGLVNRFMWMNVYRARLLPEGGDFASVTQALSPLIRDLSLSVSFARYDIGLDVPYRKTKEAREWWHEYYMGPLAAPRTGDYAKVTVRAAPIILRLAVIYAVLDREFYVDVHHLEAAKAFWDYCDQTAAFIFGDRQVDREGSKVMTKIRELIKEKPELADGGLTRTEINRAVYGGHKPPGDMDNLLTILHESGLIRPVAEVRGGRATTVWKVIKVLEK